MQGLIMERREVRYLINYKREVEEILRKYSLNTEEGRMDCAEDIKEIMLIDDDCANKNNCTVAFKEILILINRKVRNLQSYTLFEFVGYIIGMLDILELYEEDVFMQL